MKQSNYLYSFIVSILDTYSTILFGKKIIVGILILTATLMVPAIGLSGLIGVIIALLTARLLNLEPWDSRSGLYGFNSLLISLALAFYFPFGIYSITLFIAVLVVSSVVSLLLFVSLNNISMTYLKLPSMSLAFSIAAILFILFWYALDNELIYYPRETIFDFSISGLPGYWQAYLESLGSIFFLPYLFSGLMILAALIISSRIGFVLSLLGFSTIWVFYERLDTTAYIHYPGLNAILIAITVGGVFLVPGKSAYLLSILAVIIGGISLSAMQLFLRAYGTPPFTLPYVLTVYIVIYPLLLRLKNENPYLIDFGTYHPEENLIAYYNKGKRFYQTSSPQFFMPLNGEWRITQGNDGEITHKQQWSYAWDFEIYDKQDKPYRNNSQDVDSDSQVRRKPEDYYAYGKPVQCSQDGYVANIVDGIADNPIGQINTKENWGNVITIYHNIGVYSLYCHLKKGSVKVKVGDFIRKGERIASVGNSGRSAVPHLHFNIQTGAEPGANTIKSYLANYKLKLQSNTNSLSTTHYRFKPFSIPQKEETVSSLVPSLNLQDILHLKVMDKNRFKVRFGEIEVVEEWEIKTTFTGQLLIQSDQGGCLEFSFYEGIYNLLSFKGSKNTALFAFAAIISRLPYQENVSLRWQDNPPLSLFTPCCTENILLFLHSILKVVTVINDSHYEEYKQTIKVSSIVTKKVFANQNRIMTGEVYFKKLYGITKIVLYKGDKPLITVESLNNSDEKED